MIKKSTLARKLASYSALASVLGASENSVSAQTIQSDTGLVLTAGQHFYLDLNHNGQNDFSFGIGASGTAYRALTFEYIERRAGNNMAFSSKGKLPKPFKNGSLINSQLTWKSGRYSTLYYGNYHRFLLSEKVTISQSQTSYPNQISYQGLWHNLSHGYIGLRVGEGQYYYGWARLSVSFDSLTIESYGLNPIADSGIVAGKNDTISPPQIALDSLAQTCKSDSLELILSNPVSSEHLQWYQNGNPLLSDTNQTLIVKSDGYYFMTKSFDRYTYSLSNLVSINQQFLSVTVDTFNNGHAQAYAVGAAPFQYQWYLNGQLINDTTTNLIFNQPGIYWVIVTDKYGCSVTSAPITILLTGINLNPKDEIKLYTADKKLYVQLQDAALINGTINIYNTLGQSVLRQ